MAEMSEPKQEKEADFSFLVGAWEVIDCGLETAKGDSQGVVGAIFELTEDGDVTWRPPENHLDIPVFSSQAYEAIARGPFLNSLIRFGSYKGHVIEFRIEKCNVENLTMTIHEGLLYMSCKKITNSVPDDLTLELPFTLLPAYEEGYFTDLTIIASDKTEFRVHTCILKILAPHIDWKAQPPPFSGLPQNIVGSIIHYLYTYSLPSDLTVKVAKDIILIVSNYPGLDDLISFCQTFIRNVALAKELAALIADVNALSTQAIEHFAIRSDMRSVREPAVLCNAVQNSIRDIALATAKLLLFCDTYNKRKNEFSKKGEHEIIRRTKSGLPLFVNQLNTYMQVVKATFGSLSSSERRELARYLLPEMGHIFETLINLLLRTQEFFETLLLRLGPEDNAKYRLKMRNFSEHMARINHKKEVSKIRFILHRVECLVHHLKKKRDRFRSLNSENKVRSLTRNLDHLIDRLPFIFLRLEEMTEDLEQKGEWIESQFCFKMTTAKVGEFLATLLENKESLQTLILALCDVIQLEEFTQSIIALEILNCPAKVLTVKAAAAAAIAAAAARNRTEDHEFNLQKFVRDPPPPRNNALCKNALQMLKDGVEADMIFRVVPSGEPDDDDEDDENRDFGDLTDDEENSVNGQYQANVNVDASTAPVGAGPNVTAHDATTGDTKIGDAVSTRKQVDGTAHGSSKEDRRVSTGKADGAVRAKKPKDDAASSRKEQDGAARGRNEEYRRVSTGKADGAVRVKKRKKYTKRQEDGAAFAITVVEEAASAKKEDRAAHGRNEEYRRVSTGKADGVVHAKKGKKYTKRQEDGAACAITVVEEAASAKKEDRAAHGRNEEDHQISTGKADGVVHAKKGKKYAASILKEEDGAACAITEEEEGAACAITKEDNTRMVEGKLKEDTDVIIVKAHRAILATRCSLFKKALLSGMQEDLNRSIEIHNISPNIFPIFLNYLYSGLMDYSTFTPRQITDLFLVADCYELDAFKKGCETALRICIDDNSVLLFFNMADKYSAPTLKDACKRYISEHPTVSFDNMLYDEMPKKLKGEIYDLVMWRKDRILFVRTEDQSDGSDTAGACALIDDESEADVWDIQRIDIEDCVPSTDGLRFRWALQQLREIVGPGVPRAVLVQVLLAADCDLNRALNYYYSSS